MEMVQLIQRSVEMIEITGKYGTAKVFVKDDAGLDFNEGV